MTIVTSPSSMSLSLVALAMAVTLTPTAADASDGSSLAQLIRELSPAMEEAVSSALSRWQPAADFGRLQARLEAMERDLADLRASMLERQNKCQPEPKPEPEPQPEPEPEPGCKKSPSPLPADQTPHHQPAVLACARSCMQLRDQGGSPQDGVYWFTGMPVPTLCDFSHDGGGWTLLLTAVSKSGWDTLSVLGRNRRAPSLTDNYSILQHANAIRDLGSGDRFAYRIETQAELARQQWGGIWVAPRSYSFVHESPSQKNVNVVRKFNEWGYHIKGIEKRMPWVNMYSGEPAVLTTSGSPTSSWGGTMVTHHGSGSFDHSPWIYPAPQRSGTVLYWLREEVL